MLLRVTCDDLGLQNLLAITKRILSFIQIIGPLLCIVGLIITFVRLMNNPEEKKLKGRIKNGIMALVIIFVIPILVDVVMNICGDSFKISSCWQKAESNMEGSEYIESEGENKSNPLIDPNEYEGGKDSESSNKQDLPKKNQSVNILFVGNSMTYREGNAKQRITEVFKGMVKNGGFSNMKVYVANKSGSTLSQIAKAKKGLITARKYDIVILQEQTDIYENNDYTKFLKGTKKIKKLVNEKNPAAKIYIRQKWISKGNLDKSMHNVAYKNTEIVAEKIGANLIYDGKAFDNSRAKYSEINLYSDSRHQSTHGAYLSAACIYKSVTGGNPDSLTYKGYISEENAKKLRSIATSTC